MVVNGRRMLEVEGRWEAYVGRWGADGRRMYEVEGRCEAYVDWGWPMRGVCRGGGAMRGVCRLVVASLRRMSRWSADARRMLEVEWRCEAYVDWRWPL